MLTELKSGGGFAPVQNLAGKKSAFRHRFAMYDYARGNSAREDFIVALLDAAERMELDGLAIYFEDLAMFLAPEVYTGSIGLEGWRRLDREATRRGLVLLPLLNLYGHNEQTLAHPEFHHFRDDHEGTVLNLDAPDVRDAVKATLDIALGVFSSQLIHIGFDEAFGLAQAGEAATGIPVQAESVFLKHLNWAASEVIQRGRRPMFWADMPGVYFPHIIPDISRDLVAVDWFYRVEPEYPTMRRWIDSGFDLWVAPTIGYTEMVWPDNERSLASAKKVIAEGERVGATGVIFTAWEQGPFPFSARLPAAALLAELTTAEGKNASLGDATSRWVGPSLGNAAGRYAAVAAELGKLNELLPNELKRGHPAPVREAWYRCQPCAREHHVKMREILRNTSKGVTGIAPLELAHKRFSLQVASLSPEPIDASLLLAEARAVEPEILDSWLSERTADGFERNVRFQWERTLQGLESWPEVLQGVAPVYGAEILLVDGEYRESEPTVRGFSSLKDWDGTTSPEDEATTVWIWTQPGFLHLRFLCEQKTPPRAAESSVDFLLTRDDLVQFCLDFQGRGEGYLWMEANPAGTMFCQWHSSDIILSQWHPLSGRKPWATPIQSESGWGVEIAIPLSDLGISEPVLGDSMGINLGRRRQWNKAPVSRWGGMGWQERDMPACLSKIKFC